MGTDLSPGQGLEAASTPERPEAPALQAAGVPSPVLSPYPAWFPQVVGGKGRPVQGVRAPAGVQVECGSRVSRGRPGCPGAPWASAPERFHQFIDLWGDGVVSGQGGAGPQVECGDSASRCCSRRRCHLSLSCVGPSVSGVQTHRRRAGEFLTSQTSGVCLLKTTAFLSGQSQRPGPEKLVTTFAWFPVTSCESWGVSCPPEILVPPCQNTAGRRYLLTSAFSWWDTGGRPACRGHGSRGRHLCVAGGGCLEMWPQLLGTCVFSGAGGPVGRSSGWMLCDS